MASDEGPHSKAEIDEFFRKLKTNSANKVCFDCNSSNPTWASVTYGVFICIDCSAVHRSLGVHVTFVRSTQLDTNWTWSQLRSMQLGGNANAQAFFAQHNCTTKDAQQKYHSRAAALYREKLSAQVSKFNKIHGNKIVFEEKHQELPVEKESDFFNPEIHQVNQNIELDQHTKLFEAKRVETNCGDGPSVEAALSGAVGPQVPRKSTIGQRKPMAKMGVKKGIGAQKVKADFAEIEKEAEMMDQMKERADQQAKVDKEKQAEEDERQRINLSLAYHDINKQQQKTADKLRHVDPKKAEQVERLGMGIGMRTGISHSMMSDMTVIEQQNPSSMKSSSFVNSLKASPSASYRSPFDADTFFEDYEIVDDSGATGLEGLTLSAPRKNDDWGDFSRTEKKKYSSYASEDSGNDNFAKPKPRDNTTPSAGDEAQKKFGKAKAISSDQFFGASDDKDYERRMNLSRFEGSTSISSADYFGDGRQRTETSASYSSHLQNVDLDDVKESVRQGVTKVAGRLSNLANGMVSTIQEKYGY